MLSMSKVFVLLLAVLVTSGKSQDINTKKSLSPTEDLFLKYPSADTARSNLKFITSQPHVAGTSGDRIMANFVANEFENAGIPDVSIFDLEVKLNYPNMENPSKLLLRNASNMDEILYTAKLSEDALIEDDTSDSIWRNHTFHGYSPAGQIEPGSPVVYANYGRPQDFDTLSKAGVSVNGTIVLVRYGACFRGLKVQNAQERGAIGVLIFSDPAEDGYGQPDGVYPNGPWRPSFGVQRGSVQFNSRCGGDPFRADPRYLHSNTSKTPIQEICSVSSPLDLIPSIPSLPISYADATPILQSMDGPLAKDVGGDEFCGGIKDLVYRVGPSTKTVVELHVHNTANERRKVPNVVGVIPGTLPKDLDMPILLGNHRDAWVYGAADPNSGTAALLELAKGLGKLYTEENWKPKRTIYLLSWSGEEYGLLGSTGWGELNQHLIQRSLAYLNVDTIVSGDLLKASASPSLTTLWKRVLLDMNQTIMKSSVNYENEPEGNLHDANTDWHWSKLANFKNPKDRVLNSNSQDKNEIEMLGSGSDYTVFLDHLGIPSVDFRFSKGSMKGDYHSLMYGQYHSVYDSFSWMDKYGGIPGKPGSSFDLMVLGAQIWGVLTLRLADAQIVPIDLKALCSALAAYTQAIENQCNADLDLTTLKQAVQKYHQATMQLYLKCEGEWNIRTCNEKLGLAERYFLLEEGLPKRPWFKHVLQAPGMHLGYAAEAFPGIQQGIDDFDMELAQEQVGKVAERILEGAEFLLSTRSNE